MSKLRSKLERMAPPAPAAAAPTPAGSDASGLDALREKIAGILARPPAPRRAAATGVAREAGLPFVEISTPSGPLHQRIVRVPSSHRTGRYATVDARLADPGMLALLALDPELAAAPPSELLYLDTETTGLAGGTGTVPFLVGMARFEEGALVLEQLLLRQLGEEAPLLERVLAEVERAGGVVTYNGKAFDLPLLRTRLVMNRQPPLPARPHLDLVHVARRVHGKRVKPCTLTAIEAHVLGFERHGDVPGAEIMSRYRHFLRTGDDSALEGVVEHNAWDVYAMVAMVGLYGGPSDALRADDLSQVARTAMRAGADELAAQLADSAVSRGGGHHALRERAEISRARGERDRAIEDLEELLREVDDPAARLSLAKLYEHHLRRPGAALSLLERGTTESGAPAERRRARLARKVGAQATLLGEEPRSPRARRR
ncbi:MAG: ribonuclease H-like domain-containing protein [Polyangiaceae bacterium]|nr:ribonuclease H-like domain-containing protein [Polyangiaceae bacterium]